jgi:hypothetical protein
MDDWSILVPSGDSENLDLFIESLNRTHDRDLSNRVVAVVDPGCSRKLLGVNFVERPPGPFNNCKAWNAGLAVIPASHDVLLSVDDITFLGRDGIPDLLKVSRLNEGRCFVHPAVQGDRYNHPELDQSSFPGVAVIEKPCPLPLICAVIPPAIRAAVGSFDESFDGYGYSDHDYVRRAELLGFRYMVYHNVTVLHERGRSVYRRRQDFSELLQQNRRRYFEKWGEWPQR